ncbi:FhuF-like iron-sulfur protein [Pseudonocardia sediminis]|uniref:FhuF-like iron-sulfur protein n=1 Tax=Pseudonocardia sediminis TaxID=1397368 RepID=A0A4Q7V0D6_PSEST|nr:(2Fe-2S)-binding protein [Pseudonocardia sediminis]RZT87746.1 FhuF-like iron-sulfur protein [Pseudonocardia sediminis]
MTARPTTAPSGRAPVDVTAALDDVAAVGPFFALPVLDGGGAEPFARLHADPRPLSDRIARVRQSLGSDERVAASIGFQGLVARLVSAPLAAVVLHAVLPDLAGLSRRPGGDDPWAPGLTGAGGASTPDPAEDPGGAAAVLGAELVDAQLAPLVEAVRGLVAVSGHVLWGNVASALAGSARVLDSARPGSRPALLGVLGALLEHPSLSGTGRLLVLEPGVADTEWGFRRRSCCLYYRVPGGGKCGDCVLNRP